MPEDRQIPTSAPSDKPSFKILSEGNQVSETYQVLSVVVLKQANRISSAQITFKDGDPAQEDFPISNSDEFIPGRQIEIHAGYHSDEEVIFKGIVVKNSVKARKDKPSVFQVECRDEAVKLTVGRKSKYYYESKDSEIIEEIASAIGLDKNIEPTTVAHRNRNGCPRPVCFRKGHIVGWFQPGNHRVGIRSFYRGLAGQYRSRWTFRNYRPRKLFVGTWW